MGDSGVASLKRAFETNRNWSEWATIAVFVGLLGEILVIFWFSKDKPRSEIWLSVLCTLVIAAGVFGEYTFGRKAATAAGDLQKLSDQQVTDAKLKTEKLEARLTDRMLTAEQQGRLITAMKPFADTSVNVVIIGDIAEIDTISGILTTCLLKAGLILHIQHAMGGAGPIVRGIVVGTRPGSKKALHASAVFVSTLTSMAIACRAEDFTRMPPAEASFGVTGENDAIRIFIGSKP